MLGPSSRLIASVIMCCAVGTPIGVVVAQSAPSESASGHWSFVAPARPPVPESATDAWSRTPIDAFILDRHKREGLRPADQADRATLIRRLSLDLTGLPPTPEEVEAFVADARPNAYATLVDGLLQRPQYGERMALRWLDLARYADTNGYSIDGGRHMWAWRDWVIDAYNSNMPFDRFTIEQLAGDLLPDAAVSQRIASGFNRNHMNTHEGGTIAEEYRVAYVADRVKTTATTWMGLTVGCAQCHDHKYDPISQRDYYRFFAYFNTITDKGNDGDRGINSVPFLPVYDEKQRKSIAGLRSQLQAAKEELYAPSAELDEAQTAWQVEQAGIDHTEPMFGPWHMLGPFQAPTAGEAFSKDFGPEQAIVDGTFDLDDSPRWQLRADLVDGKSHSLAGARSAWYFYRSVTTLHATSVDLSFGSDDAIRVWLNGALIIDKNVRRGVLADQERVAINLQSGQNSLLVKIINDGGPGGIYFNVLRSGLPNDVVTTLAKSEAARSDPERTILLQYFRQTVQHLEPVRAKIARLEASMAEIESKPATTVMVMQEMQKPRSTYMLVRGRYDMHGDQVTAGTPAMLPALPTGASGDRLGLAKWLVDPGHPLTARVAVNGLWQMLFGTGLVKTSEDFGTQGEAPSHAALLDWLAVELIESGWDQKAMLRLMVSSATYRQSSRVSLAAIKRDPENRLLARGPTFRLAAELIRDQALAVSGLLNPKIGGPSVRPYQPSGLWKEMSHFGSTPATEQVYVQDVGDKLYRRSIYTIWKRTLPPPVMMAFDAPNRELCTTRRGRTSTPLQALVLLNETGFVEAARALAARMMSEGGDLAADRLALGFTLVTARAPSDAERAVLLGTLARELTRFQSDPAAVDELLAVGDTPRTEHLDAKQHAAWTIVASILLNLSETVTKG